MSDHNGFNFSPLARCAILGVLVLSVSACATQRYGRMTPVSPGERASLDCGQIALEIEKANFFIADIQRQRSETTGAHVLGALGDFGIGNVMEGDAAEKSGTDRLRELKVLQGGKGCASMESAASSSATTGQDDQPTASATAASGTGPITTRDEFYKLVADRPITGWNGPENFVLRSDGTMTGMLRSGATLSGPWYFDDGYFCREVIADQKSYGWDCQVVNIDGNEVTFVRKRGKGDKRKYVIK